MSIIDPEVIEKEIKYYIDNDFDNVSNTTSPTYLDELDVEVCSFESLKIA